MNLWIRSQDKMKLVNNCNLYISTEHRNEYVIEDLNNKYLKLGTYKTKERALSVLDDIQEFIENKNKIKITQDINGITSEVEDAKRVYQMPES